MREALLPAFRLELYPTYFNQGFFNVGVEYERYFAEHEKPIQIKIDLTGETVTGIIDRTANSNGTPRIKGGPKLSRFFRSAHKPGDVLLVRIVAKDSIEILEQP